MSQEQPAVTVSLDELKQVLVQVIDHVSKRRGIEAVGLENDYYWSIPATEMYRPDASINEATLEVGSLYDDWQTVRRFVLDENEPLALHLAMLAPLMRYVGEVAAERAARDGG